MPVNLKLFSNKKFIKNEIKDYEFQERNRKTGCSFHSKCYTCNVIDIIRRKKKGLIIPNYLQMTVNVPGFTYRN